MTTIQVVVQARDLERGDILLTGPEAGAKTIGDALVLRWGSEEIGVWFEPVEREPDWKDPVQQPDLILDPLRQVVVFRPA